MSDLVTNTNVPEKVQFDKSNEHSVFILGTR